MPIDEARKIDSSIRYDDWEEEYVSDNGYWLEDDPETHSIISISIFIKEVEDDNAFYSYQWCEGRTVGIGKIKDNYTFYEGYDGEPQITITVKGDEDARIHLWDGYFEDIFGNPPLSENGWSGFTKDYNQLEGALAAGAGSVEISPVEYLNDISSYKGKTFTYKETSDVVDLICELLRYAIDNGKSVTVTAE